MLTDDSSKTVTILLLFYLILSLFNGHILGRLENHLPSKEWTTTVTFTAGARLHLIVQIPVLNATNEPENSRVVLRQKEYIYCLKRNLMSPHVSLLRSSVICLVTRCAQLMKTDNRYHIKSIIINRLLNTGNR